MNVERILKLAEVIETTPHRKPRNGARYGGLTGFNMQRWHCGTVGCIAGWAHHLFSEGGKPVYEEDIQFYAADLLDLSESTADHLFVPRMSTVGDFGEISPSRAAIVLRHLAKTGVVDWLAVQS